MLNTYLTATQNLLQAPSAPTQLYPTSSLTLWINSARGQLAGEAECIRAMGTLSVAAASSPQAYPFSSISVPGASGAGIQGVLSVRTAWYSVGSGQKWMRPRPFEWFGLYELNNPAPVQGPPKVWAQYGQGAQAQTSPNPVGGGSIYISPPPDTTYTVSVDCVCWPISLASDSDPEAIPYEWTDAVPFYAAYLALLSAQSGIRTSQAKEMFQQYETFVSRGRKAVTPSVLPTIYPQNPSPVRQNQLGVAPPRGGG